MHTVNTTFIQLQLGYPLGCFELNYSGFSNIHEIDYPLYTQVTCGFE